MSMDLSWNASDRTKLKNLLPSKYVHTVLTRTDLGSKPSRKAARRPKKKGCFSKLNSYCNRTVCGTT